ncbi:MAG: glycosyltransferase family 4 protein [Planctomycetota bacterium]|jgi:glycosyltransferase involved in cell wall biosynthesis
MKIAVIIERAEIALGGAERSISELVTELRNQGVEATLLAAKGDASENTVILCNDTGGKRTSLKHFENAIQEHLKHTHYDIIHSTLPLSIADIYQPRGGSYKEAMLRNIASYPSAWQRWIKHKTHFLNFKRTEYLKAERKLCTQANVTIAALSQYVKKQFQEHYQLPDSRIAVIPNGINTVFQINSELAEKAKQDILQTVSISETDNPVLFLFAANNPRLKGLRELLYAFEDIVHNATVISPVLVIVGAKGLGEYDILANNLYYLKNRVASLGPQDQICDVLSVCDIAVLPSYYDPCSRFILEALAMGKPVITTHYNGAAERYVNHLHGITTNEPDYPLIMDALSYFCDPEKIQLAHQAIVEDNLKEEVSIENHVKKLIELYKKILNRKCHP